MSRRELPISVQQAVARQHPDTVKTRNAPRNRQDRPEQALQVSMLEMAAIMLPGVLIFHIPNGGWRGALEAAIMKGLGVRAGVADLCVMLPGGKPVFVEVKAEGGRLQDAQKDFRDYCFKNGYRYILIESIDTWELWLREERKDMRRNREWHL